MVNIASTQIMLFAVLLHVSHVTATNTEAKRQAKRVVIYAGTHRNSPAFSYIFLHLDLPKSCFN
jgi:hypothetical protein